MPGAMFGKVTRPEGSVVASRSTGPVAFTAVSGIVRPSSAVTITVSASRALAGVAGVCRGRPAGGAGAGFVGGAVCGGAGCGSCALAVGAVASVKAKQSSLMSSQRMLYEMASTSMPSSRGINSATV